MAQGKQRNKNEEEEIGLLLKRKRKPEPEVDRKASGNRFPARSDGSPALGFATLSHSNLKSWAQVRDAQGHNTRTIETPNAREGAPEPIELLDEQSGSYIERVKAVLVAHGVPIRIRKGGIIATEDVYGASPEYWNRDGDWKQRPVKEIINDPVVQAAVAHARRKHGRRLVSCSLHIDEESPHIHVIALPLVFREHAPRGPKPKDCKLDENGNPIDYRPKVAKWTLDVSSERGQSSQLERNHDDWAAACEDFGLVRGERGSDMALEERRARRNRQTGRASMAEKEAREERERKYREAEEAVDQGFAERGRLVVEGVNERDKIIGAATTRAKGITDNAERVAQEAMREADRAKKLLEEAGLAKKAAEEALAQAESDRKQQIERGQIVLNALAQAKRDRDAAAADRKEAAAKKENLDARLVSLITQLDAVAKLLGGESATRPVLVNGKLTIEGEESAEVINHFKALPKTLRGALSEQLKQRAILTNEMSELERNRGQLHDDRKKLVDDRAALGGIVLRAKAFETAWLAVPKTERSPNVQAAVQKAGGLSLSDLPPGFDLPGQGGAVRS